MNILHIYGIFLRNFILIRRSVPKLFGMFGFVTFELFMWGFLTMWVSSLAETSTELNIAMTILTALIFWHIFMRSQQSFSISFLEDIWSRNIVNLFASPVTTREFVSGLALLSIVQGAIAFIYISSLAFILYSLEIWALGLYMIPFFIGILMFGWALGLFTIGLVIRFGPSAEILAFFLPFAFLPFSAVYYPVDVLPQFLQTVSNFLPTRHLFEGMRTIMSDGTFPKEAAILGLGLDVLYFLLGLGFLWWMMSYAKKNGLIARLLTD